MIATLTIARNTLIESLRQPIVLVVIAISGLLQYLNTAISAYSMGYNRVPGEVTGDDKLLFDLGLATVFLCGMLLAAFVSTATISREIENKTVLTVVSKPISRAAVVVGKFLGVGGAMVISVAVMICYLLFAMRHGVMSTASDKVDYVVITFSFGPFIASLLLAGFANFFYGWSFPQTSLTALVPLTLLGYAMTLFISPNWQFQSLGEHLKPQILITSAALCLAVLVMSAVAVAASTRLGQVMTIVVCAGAFTLGLLSNHLFARSAFTGQSYGFVRSIEPEAERYRGFDEVGDRYIMTLDGEPDFELLPGLPFRFGPSPEGAGMITPAFAPPAEDLDFSRDLYANDVPPALVITNVDGLKVTIKQIGAQPVDLRRLPERGDWCFIDHPRISWPARLAWSAIPNMQAFWLVDAVTQASEIPMSHLGLVAAYAVLQILGLLSIAVLLFEGRDVG
ncbi:MAG: ABC transporter permease subunit [Planctomycetota bacterium]